MTHVVEHRLLRIGITDRDDSREGYTFVGHRLTRSGQVIDEQAPVRRWADALRERLGQNLDRAPLQIVLDQFRLDRRRFAFRGKIKRLKPSFPSTARLLLLQRRVDVYADELRTESCIKRWR